MAGAAAAITSAPHMNRLWSGVPSTSAPGAQPYASSRVNDFCPGFVVGAGVVQRAGVPLTFSTNGPCPLPKVVNPTPPNSRTKMSHTPVSTTPMRCHPFSLFSMRGLTFDMRGGRQLAKPDVGRPLDGRVRSLGVGPELREILREG